jgi:hypothetical protein
MEGAIPDDISYQLMGGQKNYKRRTPKPKLVTENESILGTLLSSPEFQLR